MRLSLFPFLWAANLAVISTVMAAPPHIERLDVVTTGTATGSGGNAWGGHQTRIVRTAAGVFTAFTVPGIDPLHHLWQLARRTQTGWEVISSGPSGREPVNLLTDPQGRLYITAWPGGSPRIWTSRQENGHLLFDEMSVPGNWDLSDWPYASAGASLLGDFCILQSGGDKPGLFNWAYRNHQDGRWSFHQTHFDVRYCYTYALPGKQGDLSLVSTRDVLWTLLGYKQPPNTFGYVFNAVKYWHTHNALAEPLKELLIAEAPPTPQYPDATCDGQLDAYTDTRNRTHILYIYRGSASGGRTIVHHAIVQDGHVIKDVELPVSGGNFWRIIQDTQSRFYLIGSNGLVFPATSEDGSVLGEPVALDLKGHPVEYSGIAITAPRCGVPLADYVDAVYPSGHEKEWVYFRLALR